MAGSGTEDGGQKRRQAFDDKTINEVRRAVLSGDVGYQRPPTETRFRKGTSGNPKGRPRNVDIGIGDERSANAIMLREAGRMVAIREGDQVSEIPSIDAVLRRQFASAMKDNNAYSQKHVVERYDRAERELRRGIAESNAIWRDYVAKGRAAIAAAEARGEPPPKMLPHPDDVVFRLESYVTFCGPVNEEQQASLEETLRVRNVLLMQHGLDCRLMPESESDDPLDHQTGSQFLATVLNDSVPERHRLSDGEIVLRLARYEATPLRRLLKDVYRAWRELGHEVRRGETFPSLRRVKRLLELLGRLQRSHENGEIDLADCSPEDIAHIMDAVGANG